MLVNYDTWTRREHLILPYMLDDDTGVFPSVRKPYFPLPLRKLCIYPSHDTPIFIPHTPFAFPEPFGKGLYIGNPFPPGGGISADVILGENLKRGREKGGKCKRKRKGKEK
jgi:hypothetical protein